MAKNGTLTTVAGGDYLDLAPGQALAYLLTIATAQTFDGYAALQRSLDGGQSWEQLAAFDGRSSALTAGVQGSGVIVNEFKQRARYRFATTVATSTNGVTYTLTLALAGEPVMLTLEAFISAADIISTSALKLGHAEGYPLVPAQGPNTIVELISALLVYDLVTATYGAGGNITINREAGGSAITGLVSAANSLGSASDAAALFTPLAAAAEVLTANKGLNLVSSAAFTNPGTAAGTVRVATRYRVHQLGL